MLRAIRAVIHRLLPMTIPIVLASQSETRAAMLSAAGVPFEAVAARIDEDAIRAALRAEGATPREVADALAEGKARRVSPKHPGALVIGSDQVLECEGDIFSKPDSPEAARDQLSRLSGRRHKLISAAVIYRDGEPQWRHVDEARLTMRDLSETYIAGYVARNWEDIRWSVGCYRIESEGIRLFSKVEGSHFTILGMPLVELLCYLTLRGAIER